MSTNSGQHPGRIIDAEIDLMTEHVPAVDQIFIDTFTHLIEASTMS